MFALIPAAGQSTRMGRAKLALPLGDRTVIEYVIGALRVGGVERVLVVTGPHVPELTPLALRAEAQVLSLSEATSDMRATIEHGLDWAEHEWPPTPDDAFLLVPADHPAIEPRIVRQLIDAWRPSEQRAPTIIIPTYQGRRGHPTLVGWSHVAGIRAMPPDVGLNRYLRERAPETLELPVDSDSVLIDLDAPDDYERLLAKWQREGKSC
jgi:molybdenum cofactor cytidylyltransferase